MSMAVLKSEIKYLGDKLGNSRTQKKEIGRGNEWETNYPMKSFKSTQEINNAK